MLRKIFLVSILLLSCSFAWANYPYIGVASGPETANFSQRTNLVVGMNSRVEDRTHHSGGGIFGSLFGGYALVFNRFYLAGEGNINISSVEFTSANDEFIHQNFSSTRYEMPYSLGLSLLPGFFLTETTLLYSRIGYVNGNFKTVTNDNSLANINRNLDGFRYGLGINQAVTRLLSIIVEYNRVNYRTTQSKFTVATFPIVKTTRITPKIGQVQFGLVLSFLS